MRTAAKIVTSLKSNRQITISFSKFLTHGSLSIEWPNEIKKWKELKRDEKNLKYNRRICVSTRTNLICHKNRNFCVHLYFSFSNDIPLFRSRGNTIKASESDFLERHSKCNNICIQFKGGGKSKIDVNILNTYPPWSQYLLLAIKLGRWIIRDISYVLRINTSLTDRLISVNEKNKFGIRLIPSFASKKFTSLVHLYWAVFKLLLLSNRYAAVNYN